jgi:hypothetical protein
MMDSKAMKWGKAVLLARCSELSTMCELLIAR